MWDLHAARQKDTAANIESLAAGDISALATAGVASLTAADASVVLSLATAIACQQSGLKVGAPAGDTVTVADTGANIALIDQRGADTLKAACYGSITSTKGAVTLSLAELEMLSADGLDDARRRCDRHRDLGWVACALAGPGSCLGGVGRCVECSRHGGAYSGAHGGADCRPRRTACDANPGERRGRLAHDRAGDGAREHPYPGCGPESALCPAFGVGGAGAGASAAQFQGLSAIGSRASSRPTPRSNSRWRRPTRSRVPVLSLMSR